MNFPVELFYSKEHTWLKIEDEIGTVGITEFAQEELGEIVYVDLPNNGYTFKQGEVFGSVEAIKTVSDLFMPITGSIIEANKRLLKEPSLVNSEAFGNGWVVKIKILDIEELKSLFTSDLYKQHINY